MKKIYTLLILVFTVFVGNSQIINFPDPDFKTVLLYSSPDFHIAKDLSGNYFKIDTNNDNEIQYTEALQVSYLDINAFISFNDITGIENFTNLQTLLCASNHLTILNLNALTNLQVLDCSNNELKSLNLTGLINLKNLDCSWNQISSLKINDLINLQQLDCRSTNPLGTLDVSSLVSLQTLYCSYTGLTSLNVNGLNNLNYIDCDNNYLTSLNLNGLNNLHYLSCNYNSISTFQIYGLTQLESLNCMSNKMTTLTLNDLPNLKSLDCQNNKISTLNLAPLTSLQTLSCSLNPISNLDLSGLTNIENLYCYKNQLTSLDLTGLINIEKLYCYNNQLTSLNLTGLTNLNTLQCHNNQITLLDVSPFNLSGLMCGNNLITTLDLSNSTILSSLRCSNNPLVSLFLKNGNSEYIEIENTPTLTYICADEQQITKLQQIIDNWKYTNCHINSYCSFNPGGLFYTIKGNNRYDEKKDGCDDTDINYSNLKLSFTDGVNAGSLIADATGTYRYDVQAGTQIITPSLENPTYFTISPTTVSTNFPNQTSPFIQDFCISGNGTHNDLEVVLIPCTRARPGFDANYIILYKNKGSNTQSGTITLSFDDNVLDLVSAIPNVTNNDTNTLNWDFNNLLPFETREILVTLNVNSPLETPAVNNDDILNFTANVIGVADETPNDNTSNLKQTVVNSFDPNDKTCLEGTTITPNMIGEYIHYIVRFENTGTAGAENIVVKDIIDTTKFDISSLVPLNGSASFSTRITNNNQAEFIFANINLPFDDANNDGYIAFKIKTKSTMAVGDTFRNSANIYFDYNYPIVTNTAITTVAVLDNPDLNFSTYFNLSPVPVKNTLRITAKQNTTISSISTYNTLGQLVQTITNPSETIDVSNLKTGNYIIKIVSDRGSAVSKFIKE